MNPKNQVQHNHQKRRNPTGILRFFAAVATVITLLCLTPHLSSEAATGTLDAAFGDGGKVITDFSDRTDHNYGVAIQADGKIVAAGPVFNASNDNFAVARYIGDAPVPQRTLFDFDGDGKADILWRHQDGQVATWTMDGAAITNAVELAAAPDGQWQIFG